MAAWHCVHVDQYCCQFVAKQPEGRGSPMASLQNRNGSWRVIFRFKGQWHAFTIGEVSPADAAVHKASAEELLRLLRRHLLDLPSGCTIEHFLFHRGKPPEHAIATANAKKELTLAELRDVYLQSQ